MENHLDFFQHKTAKDFPEVCNFIKNLPYKRNKEKSDIFCVLKDKAGTCSSKHAFLKFFADEKEIENVQLLLGIFRMNAENTPKIKPILQKYQLKEIPEAHNYLKIDNEIVDCTNKSSKPEDFINDLIEEIEIQPNQITGFKVDYHQNFFKNYLQQNPEIPYSLDEFWKIREECIEKLSKQKSR